MTTSVNLLTGPMYSYDAVVAALAPVFNSNFGDGSNTKPLCFCADLPFKMASTRILKAGNYGGWNQWQDRDTKWNQKEKKDRNTTDDMATPPGPIITLSHFWDNGTWSCVNSNWRSSITTTETSDVAPKFTFVKYTPTAGEYPDVPAGKSIILLHVEQPGRGLPGGPCDIATSGYVIVSDNGDSNRAFGASMTTLAGCIAAKVRYGVVWRTDSQLKTSIQLYFASTFITSPSCMGINPGWDEHYRQSSEGEQALAASNFIFFGIARPVTPDAGKSWVPPAPYSWTYNSTTMKINDDATWSEPWVETLQFQLKYLVTTDGMEAYLNTYCTGTTRACRNTTYPTCTKFRATGAIGTTCTIAALLDEVAASRVKLAVCGFDWKTKGPFAVPPRASDVEALKTIDCSCINYSQSTFKQPALAGRNWKDYQAWCSANNINPISANAYCWWPTCTDPVNSLQSLTLLPKPDRCPDVTTCINSIGQATIGGGSSLVINAANKCGGAGPPAPPAESPSPSESESPSPSPSPSPSQSPSPSPSPTGGPPPPPNAASSITSQKWFIPVVVVVVVLLLAGIAYWYYSSRSKPSAATPPLPRATAVPTPFPAPTPVTLAAKPPVLPTA